MERKKSLKHRLPMQHYPEGFKRTICEEYIAAGGSKTALLRKYNTPILIEYNLTGSGRTIISVIYSMINWGMMYRAEVIKSRWV